MIWYITGFIVSLFITVTQIVLHGDSFWSDSESALLILSAAFSVCFFLVLAFKLLTRYQKITNIVIIVGLIAVVGFLMFYLEHPKQFNLTVTNPFYPTITENPFPITVDEVIKFTNLEREKAGLKPLIHSDLLDKVAEAKINDMVNKNYWSHNSPSGITPWYWFNQVGYNYVYAGENIAKNYYSSKALVEGWMESPEHKENILRPVYTEIGIGIREDFLGQKWGVTQEFGTPSQAGSNYVQPSLNITDIKSYLDHIKSIKPSWEAAYGTKNKEDLDTLIDSFNRQIAFCETLIQKLSGGQAPSLDDINLWNGVIKMGDETAALTNKLNGK